MELKIFAFWGLKVRKEEEKKGREETSRLTDFRQNKNARLFDIFQQTT